MLDVSVQVELFFQKEQELEELVLACTVWNLDL